MADIPGLRAALIKKTGKAPRSVDRWIQQKEITAHQTRDVAALLVAAEHGVQISKFATEAELALVRQASNGGAPAPAVVTAVPTTSRASRSASTRSARAPRPKTGRTVMVVYGRDDAAKKAMFKFLESLDLKPMSWTQGISQSNLPNPSVRQIVDALFEKAVAVVVLLTPDDDARLKPKFHKTTDHAYEKEFVGQARPNVLFEAGMAMSSHPERTVLTQLGNVKPFTDVGGIHITHLNNSLETRKELRTKLINAKCQVDLDSDKWRKAGNFELMDEEESNG